MQSRTKHAAIFAALARPFESHEVKVRQQAGRQLHYITARTAMNRLDDVLGPENWWDSFLPMENSVLCTLSIRLPSGEVISKQDAGGYAGMSDQGDDDKSGYSDSFKRAAVKFGVARYLYRDGVPEYVRDPVDDGSAAPGPEPAAKEKESKQAPKAKPLTFKQMLNRCLDARMVAKPDKPRWADEVVRHLIAWGIASGKMDAPEDTIKMSAAWQAAELIYKSDVIKASDEAMQYLQGRRPSQGSLDGYAEDREGRI